MPVFNRLAVTRECLASLRKQAYSSFKTIIVDHGTDDTTDMIKCQFPECTVLKGDPSMWWSAATNLGIKHVFEIMDKQKENFVLTLNNDLVVENSYLGELVKTYNANKPCVVGSLSFNMHDDTDIDFAGLRWNALTAKLIRMWKPGTVYTEIQKKDNIVSDFLPGRGTLIPAEVFDKVGLFDEINFPQSSADYDFSYQARKNGFPLIISTKAVVKSSLPPAAQKYTRNPKGGWKLFWESQTSIRSNTNYKTRWNWARKNTKIGFLYFFLDTVRVTGSFWRAYLKARFGNNKG